MAQNIHLQTIDTSNKPFELNSKYILIIAAIFIMATLAADVVAYKMVSIGPLIESGATFIFPITYLLGDVVTEVYGFRIARQLIWLNLACELIFAALILGVIHLKSPPFWHHQREFEQTLGNMMRFVASGIVANIISDFLNIYLISKWKIFMKGKYFWLRSIASTSISELILIIIVAFSAFTGPLNISQVFRLSFSAYALELFYAFIFVWPSWILILHLKKKERMDVYDHNVSYNPFKF